MDNIPKSPYYVNDSERRAALFKAWGRTESFSEDDENDTNFETKNEEAKEQKTKNTLDINTPWPVLIQQAYNQRGTLIVTDRIEVPGEEQATEIASIALKKCAMRLQKETESSLSELHNILLGVLKNNRVARRSLTSTVRMFRELDAESLHEILEEQQVQNVIVEEAKQTSRKQAQQQFSSSNIGDPTIYS
jgi:hypothetical protein